MGNFANTLFSSLLGWLRGAAAWLWSFLNQPDRGGFIVWVADHWLVLTILLCAVCMVIDWVVYMIRWRPYKVWASFFRRVFGRDREGDTGRIRRRWIHADGTTSIEEVDLAEAPIEQPAPSPYMPEPEQESLSARYARFQRPPAEEPVVPVAPVEPEPVYEAAPAAPQPEPQPETAEPRPQRQRRRRYSDNPDALPLNYVTPPATENATDFHEPYYPQQWKRPADTGASNVDLGGSGL